MAVLLLHQQPNKLLGLLLVLLGLLTRATTLAPPTQEQQKQQKLLQSQSVPPGWMMQCCQHMQLRDIYLPGTHDSGTFMWTTPKHMPLVLDVVLAELFNIVGDLARTQTLTVYQQLQAGARVLDLRLAINPWLALQARGAARRTHTNSRRSSSVGQDLYRQDLYRLDPYSLEGSLNLTAAGGGLTASELPGTLVMSHSLPAAPLAGVLQDIRAFLSDKPGEVVVLLVKADTVDVNVAGSLRMTPEAWAAAAEAFRTQLQGVQLLDESQVRRATLGELAAAAPGSGSVLLYSWELQQQGLPAVTSKQLQILESWGNGTNTDDVGDLKQRMLQWLAFWRAAGWRQDKPKPYMLLASAEVTLGVTTILDMIKNRIWRLHQQGSLQQQQGPTARALLQALAGSPPAAAAQPPGATQRRRQPPCTWWRRLLAAAGWPTQCHYGWQQQQQRPDASLNQDHLAALASGATTLYQLGVETNRQLLQDVLQNNEVPLSFNCWSMDAVSPDVVRFIIGLNEGPVQPS